MIPNIQNISNIMRKFGLLFLFLICGFFAQAGVHRCGTLNILVSKSDDTGERAWDNRKEALVSVVRDSINYDIVGFNEVTATQLTYLKNQLGSIYTFVQRSGTNASANQVLYRTSKYNCLATGSFFLAPDPTKSGKAWDAKEPRWAVWAKLQDKKSGEILVFASTHLDINPISIREGARVAAEQINQVAGDYACIITGDLNSEPDEHDSHAYFCKYLGNARYLSKTTPQGSYGTFIPGMQLQTANAKWLDFLYVKNVEIENYLVYNTPITGRTLAISDHLPVVAEVTILSPDREFVHTVKNVADLRQVAHDIQPNDIIYLKDGTFDLGDSTLYVANTCIIEGSKNAVLTGKTQLFSLPDYVSLELRNLTIRGASCTTRANGSVLHAHGAYLNVVNCTIENCSAAGEGLFYVEDCATTFDNCVFRNNKNEDLCSGIEVVSSLGIERYPFTMTSCLFDSNHSFYASALYFMSEATAYLHGNSFVHNTAEEKGVITISALRNTQDIRLVNNTFVDNRIDVEAGFMSEGVGGSVLWQEQAAEGVVTLMNNTIVGNYTACWDEPGVSSTDFMGGAICSYMGKMALYNNVLAGNYGSKPNSGDITMGESGVIKSTAYNVFSSTDNMSITPGEEDFVAKDYAASCQELKQLYGGSIDEQGAYTPELRYVKDNPLPVLSPFVTKYNGKNIAKLDNDAMSASLLGSDILNRGSNTGFLTTDQVGTVRNTYSVPGSMEAKQVEPSSLPTTYSPLPTTRSTKLLRDGQIIIQHNNTLYNSIGNKL